MKVFTIDTSRCVGCYTCQLSCKDENVSNDWMPYTKPQPDIGQFWMNLKMTEREPLPSIWKRKPGDHLISPRDLLSEPAL